MIRFSGIKDNRTKPLALFYIILFLVIFGLTTLTPLTDDDFSYSYSFADDTRITSVAQIIPSMVEHRQIINGRVFVHGLVSLILMLPKPVFNSLNGLNAVALFYLLSKYLDGSSCRKAICLAFGAMAIWCYLPAFGQNVLWLDGAFNYVWGYTFFLLFLWPYSSQYLKKTGGELRSVSLLGHVLLSFFAGAYSENASFIFFLLACCLTVLIVHREKHVPFSLIPGLVAMLGGWIFLATAPASSHRHIEWGKASLSGILSTAVRNIAGIIQGMESYLFWLLMIDILLLVAASHYHGRKKVLTLSGLFIAAGLASMVPFAFAAYYLPRHYCCCTMLFAFAFVMLLHEILYLEKVLPVKLLAAYLSILFLFRFSLGVLDIGSAWYNAREREQVIREAILSGNDSVTIQNHVPMTRYALQFRLSDDAPELYPNIVVSSYYRDKYGRMIDIYGKDP